MQGKGHVPLGGTAEECLYHIFDVFWRSGLNSHRTQVKGEPGINSRCEKVRAATLAAPATPVLRLLSRVKRTSCRWKVWAAFNDTYAILTREKPRKAAVKQKNYINTVKPFTWLSVRTIKVSLRKVVPLLFSAANTSHAVFLPHLFCLQRLLSKSGFSKTQTKFGVFVFVAVSRIIQSSDERR